MVGDVIHWKVFGPILTYLLLLCLAFLLGCVDDNPQRADADILSDDRSWVW